MAKMIGYVQVLCFSVQSDYWWSREEKDKKNSSALLIEIYWISLTLEMGRVVGKLTLNGFGVKFDPKGTFTSVHTGRWFESWMHQKQKHMSNIPLALNCRSEKNRFCPPPWIGKEFRGKFGERNMCFCLQNQLHRKLQLSLLFPTSVTAYQTRVVNGYPGPGSVATPLIIIN